MKTTTFFSQFTHVFYAIVFFSAVAVMATLGETPPLNRVEAIGIVEQACSEFGGCPTNLVEIATTNSNAIVVGFRADTNSFIRPPRPDAPYCFRVWIDRSTREILPSPLATGPGLTVSNVIDIVRNEDPSFSYATNREITQLHLSETTITRFPAWKPEIPPGYGWLGPDFASIVWIDNATSNILFCIVGN